MEFAVTISLVRNLWCETSNFIVYLISYKEQQNYVVYQIFNKTKWILMIKFTAVNFPI